MEPGQRGVRPRNRQDVEGQPSHTTNTTHQQNSSERLSEPLPPAMDECRFGLIMTTIFTDPGQEADPAERSTSSCRAARAAARAGPASEREILSFAFHAVSNDRHFSQSCPGVHRLHFPRPSSAG